MVVVALDVLGVLLVEFLEGRSLVELGTVDAVDLRDFLVGHVQRVHVGAVVLVELVGREGRESKEQGENKARGTRREERGTRCARHPRPET